MNKHSIFLISTLLVLAFALVYANEIHENITSIIPEDNEEVSVQLNDTMEINEVDIEEDAEEGTEEDTEEVETPPEQENPIDDNNDNRTNQNEQILEAEETVYNNEENNPRIPAQANLDIPFYAQAPDGNWRLPWSEACEEASILLASAFLENENLTKEVFKERILNLVEVQNEIFGKYIDTSIAETDRLYRTYNEEGQTLIIEDPTIEDLQYHIAQGHPILAPFAGKQLENPHFINGGPRYHMLVIRGYDQEYFYTNDVGTRSGENFPYTHENLMSSLHDLVPKGTGDMNEGDRRVLVILN